MNLVLGQPVRLGELPPGLFMFNGTLALKSQYGHDCFIVSNGEAFWGGTNNVSDLARLMVQPVSVVTPKPTPQPYASFLAVQNGKVVDIYYNGIQLGTCRYSDGVVPDLHFTPNLISGQPIDLHHLPHPCPFTTEREFKLHLMKVIDSIRFPEPKHEQPSP